MRRIASKLAQEAEASALALTIRVNLILAANARRQLICGAACESIPMHKTPKQIARSLRAFKNAHRLGFLQHVCISPGRAACEVALTLRGIEFPGNAVPRLPLDQCASAQCECKYQPVGSAKMRRLVAGTLRQKPRPPV